MLSTDQNASPLSQNSNCPPKRFLRKGEGLKRFAAYKPPLPTTVKKVERRRTFVKFNLDVHNKANVKREPPLHFLPPEILNDDSINLSTEIPKIAPPKIIHTPIRPNRNALGAITNCCPDEDDASTVSFTDSRINGNIDNIFKKIEDKKCILDHEHQEYNDSFNDFVGKTHNEFLRRQHLSSRNQSIKHKQKQQDFYDETDDSVCGSNSPSLAKPLCQILKVGPKFDLSNPSPGTCILEMGKRIQRIESTMNELKEKIEKCECGAMKTLDAQPTTRSRRPVTRAAAKAAKSQSNTISDKTNKQSTKANHDDKKNRPSADADNCNSTKEVLNNLVNEIAELKSQIETLRISE